MHLYDVENSGYLRAADMSRVLCQMNRVASYFGDPVMTEEQINSLVNDVLGNAGSNSTASASEGLAAAGLGGVQISYADYVRGIAEHQTVVTFINGGGTTYYGQKNSA